MMEPYLLKTVRVTIIAVLTLFLAQVVYAQNESNRQQSELQSQIEEMQKQQDELQIKLLELQKQQEALQRQQVERIAELQEQQAERLKEQAAQRVAQITEMLKQQAERLKEQAAQQAARTAEMQEQQAERLKEQAVQRAAQITEMLKQQAERLKEQAAQQAARTAEMQKQQAARTAEMQKQQAARLKEQAARQIAREKQQIERLQKQLAGIKEREKQQGGLFWSPESGIVWQPVDLSEYEIEIKKEYSVSASPSLFISNMYGNIHIIEGADNRIIFNIKITGKGKDKDEAKKYAETVDVDFSQNGNNITAKTVFKEIQCDNCGRNVNYEVTVPKNTKQIFDNKYGDIIMGNAVVPLDVNLTYGNLFADELSEANLEIQYGGASVNKCKNLNLKSSFSRYELGIIDTMTGSISYDGFEIDELGNANLKSDFSNMDIDRLRKSFEA